MQRCDAGFLGIGSPGARCKYSLPKCIFLSEGFYLPMYAIYNCLNNSKLYSVVFFLPFSAKNKTMKSQESYKKEERFYSLFSVLSKGNLGPDECIALSVWNGFLMGAVLSSSKVTLFRNAYWKGRESLIECSTI